MLSEQQVLYVQTQLRQNSIKTESVKEEILDHLCCDIEIQMAAGLPFHTACQTTFNRFQEDEMQDIETHFFNLNNHKQLIMKKVSVLAFGLMLLATALWAFQSDPPSRLPLADGYKVTSGFGKRLHPIQKVAKMHKGVDFKAALGTPVYATSDGTILTAKNDATGYGNHVIIQHDEVFQSLYGQMSEIKVEIGQVVKKGDLIGLVGSSGASTGPHLHYEVRKNGEPVDPSPYLKP